MCVPANDVDALYQAMRTLALNPELARQWGERSTERAYDLTPEAGAEKWVRVFDHFVDGKARNTRELGRVVEFGCRPDVSREV